MNYKYIIILGLLLAVRSYAVPGKISGVVIDAQTKEPLIGANVLVIGTEKGSATNVAGEFEVLGLAAGSYNVEARYLGYETAKKGNVIVNPKRNTKLVFRLNSAVLEGETVQVQASYFEKPSESVVSTRSMDFEEIRRSPGDLVDIQRAVQSLPAVVSGSDQMNEIIVRGGYPGENLFVMDNIEIPNPNHFAVQGAGGGPINMLNSYMVRSIDFYAGAFSARYGDKASSVMNISLREGSDERLRGEGSLGMAGAGVLIEGPLSGNSNFIFSARRSYLDMIVSSVGLTAVPKYSNFQGKLSWHINRANTLYINSVYGRDRINIEEGEEAGYGRGAENVESKDWQLINGATLRTFWNPRLFSETTVSAVSNDFWVDVYEMPDEQTTFSNNSNEAEYTLKTDFNYFASKNVNLGWGAGHKIVQLKYKLWNEADTLFLYDPASPDPDTPLGVFAAYPEYNVDRKINSHKNAVYGHFSWDMWTKLKLTGGLRYDYFEHNRFSSWSPRAGLAYRLNSRLTLNAAFGRHYQTPEYIIIAANQRNNLLRNKYTNQFVAGIDVLLREDMQFIFEGYTKKYYDIPINKIYTTPNPYDYDDQTYLNEGSGESMGVELFFQKKLTRRFSSIISYAYSKTTSRDVRFNTQYNADFDYRHVFTFVGGYKFTPMGQNWYQSMKSKWWFHVLSWLPFFPADEFETSLKFRYLGGRPYTPAVYHPELREWVVEETQSLNTTRYPAYHRLDIRIDRRFIFNQLNLVIFFDLVNIYNRDNIWNYQYNDDGTRKDILQYSTLPVGGISVEF